MAIEKLPEGFLPLSRTLRTQPDWLIRLLQVISGGGQLLDQVGLSRYVVQADEERLAIAGTVQILEPIRLSFPGMDGASLQLLPSQSGAFTALNFRVEVRPQFRLTLEKPSVRLHLPKGFLKPARRKQLKRGERARPDDPASYDYEVDPSKDQVALDFVPGSLTVDGDGAIAFDGAGEVRGGDMALGKSGLFLVGVQLGLQHSVEGFGFSIPQAMLVLPDDLAAGLPPRALVMRNARIDGQGFSGSLFAAWKQPLGVSLLGFKVGLQRLGLAFEQNRLSQFSMQGRLGLPFFDNPDKPASPVRFSAGIDAEGRVSVSLAPPTTAKKALPSSTASKAAAKNKKKKRNAIAKLELSHFDLELGQLDIASVPDEQGRARGEMTLSGWVVLDPKGTEPLPVEVRDLKLRPDGSVHFPGGWFDVKDKLTYHNAGFAIGIRRVGMGLGAGERGESFVGFDGALRLPGKLAAGASVEGLRYVWDKDGNHGFRIGGVGLDFTVPNAFRFGGALQFFDAASPPNLPGFEGRSTSGLLGKVKVVLLPLNMVVDADLLVGRDHRGMPFWFVKLGLESPVGILLGASGLSIYGFHGLIAGNMVPNKQPPEHWYRDWYRREPIGVDHSAKWRLQQGGAGFGVGVTLGTAFDDGQTFNARAMLVLSLPGPVVMLSGKAGVLTKRSELSNPRAQAPFDFLLLFDGADRSLLFNLEVNYVQKKLLEVRGLMELFFQLNDPDRWHLYLGQKPEPKRIQAGLLNFLKANAYLTLDQDQFLFGFFVGYRPKPWVFGPVKLTLAAFMRGLVEVGWNPGFFNASLQMYGEIGLSVFWFKLGLLLEAAVQVATPKPFLLDILARVKVSLPFPLPSPEVKLHLSWKELLPPDFSDPLSGIQLDQHEALEGSQTWALSDSAEFADGYRPVPMDACLSLVFERPVGLSQAVAEKLVLRRKDGSLAKLPTPPSSFVVGKDGVQYSFDYRIVEISLKRREGRKWVSGPRGFDDGMAFSWATQRGAGTDKSRAQQARQRSVLQINSIEPSRMLRTLHDMKLPKSTSDTLMDFVCPPPVALEMRCWQPEEVGGVAVWSGSRAEKDFTLALQGLCYRGDVDPCDGQAGPLAWPEGPAAPPWHLPIEPTVEDKPLLPMLEPTAAQSDGWAPVTELAIDSDFMHEPTDSIVLQPEQPGLVCVRAGKLSFAFHEPMARVHFRARAEGILRYSFFDDRDKEIAAESLDLPLGMKSDVAGPTEGLRGTLEGTRIARLEIEGDCFCLTELCYLPDYERQRAEFVDLSHTYWRGAIEKWADKAFVLEPDSVYRLSIKIEGTRQAPGQREADRHTFVRQVYFKTQGPPADLRPYIEATSPDADAELVFRDYYLDVRFRPGCDYLPRLFRRSDLRLTLRTDSGKATELPIFEVEGETMRLTRTQKLLRTSCHEGDVRQAERDGASLTWRFGPSKTPWRLEPATRYTARVESSVHPQPLYEFSFVTSRFLHFADLVTRGMTQWVADRDHPRDLADGLLASGRAAAFRIEDDDRQLLDTLRRRYRRADAVGHDTLNATDRESEGDDFDELARALKFPPYLRPAGTEVTQIRDDGHVYGFVVDFAEPLDWRRTTASATLRRIEVHEGGQTADRGATSEYSVLRSQDGSRAFFAFEPASGTDDRPLRLELSVAFRYTLDFVQHLRLGGDPTKIEAFFEQHPELPVLARVPDGQGSSVEETATVHAVFAATKGGER